MSPTAGKDLQQQQQLPLSLQDPDDIEEFIETYIDHEDDTQCGVGQCRGGLLQRLAKPVVYLIASSVIALVQGVFYTYSNATLSSVEKDFGLPSKLSGLTTTGNDVIQLLLSIPLPFFASRGHRPRWLAFGMFLSTLGCAVAALPHFIFSTGRLEEHLTKENFTTEDFPNNEFSYCNRSNSSDFLKDDCQSSNFQSNYITEIVVSLFLIAQMLAGVATLLYYTIGHSYLDEAVAKENVPIFLSISGAMRLLGPVCGYSLASWVLSLWKYPSKSAEVSITPNHPHWVGAWWLGFLITGGILLAISWVLILLPKTLPSTRRRRLRELRTVARKGTDELRRYVSLLRPTKIQKWKELLPSIRRLTSNHTYRLIVLKQVLFWFAFFGYITFKSKYLEHQFRLSAAQANKYIAVASLLAAFVGWLGTGGVLSFFKPKPRTVILYMAVLSSISCLCHLCQLSIFCEHSKIEGFDVVQMHPESTSLQLRSDDSCEEECSCITEQFFPVCLNQNYTFFNPCFAKCSTIPRTKSYEKDEDGEKTFTEEGFCAQHCPTFIFYLIVSVLAKMANAASRVPANILLLRCTDERDKDLGLGIFNAMVALGSSIPAPIIFGWAIDSSCIVWDISACKQRKACWLYDVDMFRKVIHGLPAGILALCVVVDLLLLRHHDTIQLYSMEISEDEREKKSTELHLKDQQQSQDKEDSIL